MKKISRRLLIRKTINKVLPIMLLAQMPLIKIMASERSNGCKAGCKGACRGGCLGSCRGSCRGSCKGTCTNHCNISCVGNCLYSSQYTIPTDTTVCDSIIRM